MKYFKNNYKKMILPTIFLISIGIITSIFPIITIKELRYRDLEYFIVYMMYYTIGISIFIAIYEFSLFKKRSSADLYYSVPTSIKKVKLQIYIKGLIEILIAITLVYLLGVIIILSHGLTESFSHVLLFYLYIIFGSSLLYSFTIFLFSKGNNVVDGIIIMGLFFVLMPIIVQAIRTMLYRTDYYINFTSNHLSPFTLIFNYKRFFVTKISRINFDLPFYEQYDNSNVYLYIIWIVLSVVSIIYYILNNKEKTENIGNISNSMFGYKTLIPLNQFFLAIATDISFKDTYYILELFLIILLGYIGYLIYERTFKIKRYNAIILVIVPVLGVLVTTIIEMVVKYFHI